MAKNKNKQTYLRSDRQLAMAAGDAIRLLTTIPPERIHITAHNGHLCLDGRVGSLPQRIVLEDVTRVLPGVQSVTNLICVEADPVFTDVRAVL